MSLTEMYGNRQFEILQQILQDGVLETKGVVEWFSIALVFIKLQQLT